MNQNNVFKREIVESYKIFDNLYLSLKIVLIKEAFLCTILEILIYKQ